MKSTYEIQHNLYFLVDINPRTEYVVRCIAETTWLDKQIATSIYVIGASDLRNEGRQG